MQSHDYPLCLFKELKFHFIFIFRLTCLWRIQCAIIQNKVSLGFGLVDNYCKGWRRNSPSMGLEQGTRLGYSLRCAVCHLVVIFCTIYPGNELSSIFFCPIILSHTERHHDHNINGYQRWRFQAAWPYIVSRFIAEIKT